MISRNGVWTTMDGLVRALEHRYTEADFNDEEFSGERFAADYVRLLVYRIRLQISICTGDFKSKGNSSPFGHTESFALSIPLEGQLRSHLLFSLLDPHQ